MTDENKSGDPRVLWRSQSKEDDVVRIVPLLNRRAREMSSSTRSEILLSIGAAVFFLAVIIFRFRATASLVQELGFGLIVVWIFVSLHRFRADIFVRRAEPADTAAVSGIEFYRRELQRRRDHLRDRWIWQGPLVLAVAFAMLTFAGAVWSDFRLLIRATPFLLLLMAWMVLAFVARRRKIRSLEDELAELKELQL